MNYYNENDPKTAAWLKQLIVDGIIPRGHVDERSIVEVQPGDLSGYTQCHFFAGVGGWSEALRIAGWPSDRPVWTGSCPCQPFSTAGKQRGNKDERHLWPEFRRLISQSLPPVLFGEQVASKLGRQWLAGVRTELEALGYGVGGADLCASGCGAPHIRQRLYLVADLCSSGLERRKKQPAREECQTVERSGDACGVGDSNGSGSQPGRQTTPPDRYGRPVESNGNAGFWSRFDVIQCRDGKARRIEPGSFPLAYGVSGRVGLLRGYGNAIVPQVAAAFIEAIEPFLSDGW